MSSARGIYQKQLETVSGTPWDSDLEKAAAMTLHRKNGTWLGAGIRAHIQNINCTIRSPLLAHHAQRGQQEDKNND